MVEVNHSAEFKAWFDGLSQADAASTLQVVKLLGMMGVTLPAPHSKPLNGTEYAIRELRPQSGRSPLRILYAFDPTRNAYLLLGGSKTEAKLYKKMLKRAEKIWTEYLTRRT